MKKLYLVPFIFTLFFGFSLCTYAAESEPILLQEETYNETAQGDDTLQNADRIEITKNYVFEGIITPATTRAHIEMINGDLYYGTLRLKSFMHLNNKTYCTYSGVLYRQH